MEFHLLPIFSFLTLVLVAAHAASSPEHYWKSKLPTTPMPKAITNLFRLGGSLSQNDPNSQVLVWGRRIMNHAQPPKDPNNQILFWGRKTTNNAQLKDDPNNQILFWGSGITNGAQSKDDPNNQILLWGQRITNGAQSKDDSNNQILFWGHGTIDGVQSKDDPNNQILLWGQGTTDEAQSKDNPNNQILLWGQGTTNGAQSKNDPNNQILFWGQGTINGPQSKDDPNNQILIWGQGTTDGAQLKHDPNNQILLWGQETTDGAQSKDDPNNQIILWGQGITDGAQSKNDPNNQILLWGQGTSRKTHLHNMNLANFFLEKDLQPGAKMDLRFTTRKYIGSLLPREVVEPIPFSLGKIQEIVDKFSVKPGSEKAQIIEKTLSDCEQPGVKGEERYCATSLESMVDFITSKLGENVQSFSTEMEKETQFQKFTVKPGVKKLAEDKVIACHRRDYAYAVFLCHSGLPKTTRAYSVPLEGADGTRVKAIAICHTDTSDWDPNHVAFQVLKVKRGTVPVCHFSPDDNVVWLPK